MRHPQLYKKVLLPIEELRFETKGDRVYQVGDHQMPRSQHWFIEQETISPDMTYFSMVSTEAKHKEDPDRWLYVPKTGEPSIKWTVTLNVTYYFPEITDERLRTQRYQVDLQAASSKFSSENAALSWGILDTDFWPRIAPTLIGFPCHVMSTLNAKGTLANKPNTEWTLEQRLSTKTIIRGFYRYYVNTIVPDWDRGLVEFGIPLSQEKVRLLFSEAAKQVKRPAKPLFTISRFEDDGGEQITFTSAYGTKENPLHAKGEDSRVINFGCGSRPAFTCSNAASLLGAMRFYALTSYEFPPEHTMPTNPEEGNAIFDQLRARPEFVYQIFGIATQREAEPLSLTGKREREEEATPAKKTKAKK